MFTPDFERFDLDLTVELWRQRRALERRRLCGLLAVLEDDEMALSPTLRGLGSKLAQFKHDVEYEAAQLSGEIDTAATETKSTFDGAHGVLAAHRQEMADVKSFVAEVAQATNGGPVMDAPAVAEPVAPPPVPLAPGAPGQTQPQ